MKCRNIIKENDVYHVVWFNSIGKDENGKSIKYKNYVEDTEAIVASLTQQLSVIKSELWYDINNGIPLLEKPLNKAILDSSILNIINNHQGIKQINYYKSTLNNKEYNFIFKALSIYGNEIDLNFELNIV